MPAKREAVEELLELCWTAAEDRLTPLDRHQLPTQLACFLPQPIDADMGPVQETIDAMIAEGLLQAEHAHIQLSDEGRAQAHEVVRRHRLTEVLLDSVLDVSDASVESTACQVEHILNPEVTEAVCAFLGHPLSCQHGRAIPRGRCCEAAAAPLEPLIVPLASLAIGEQGTIAFLHSRRHGYLQRLSALGVIAGQPIRVRQTQPALVLQLGETELALDHEAAREIFVKRRRAPERNGTQAGATPRRTPWWRPARRASTRG